MNYYLNIAYIFLSTTFFYIDISKLYILSRFDIIFSRISKAGLYAIFATQSNDFALGYPILLALYEKVCVLLFNLNFQIANIFSGMYLNFNTHFRSDGSRNPKISLSHGSNFFGNSQSHWIRFDGNWESQILN